MIIPLPPYEFPDVDKYKEEQNKQQEEAQLKAERFEPLLPPDILHLENDQYIIDPDYAELLGISDFQDLIKTRR